MENKLNKSRGFALLGVLAAAMLVPGCASNEGYSGGGSSTYSTYYYGDPYWGYGPWYIYDDDHHHHRPDYDYGRPGRPNQPIERPQGQRPSQLPARPIPAPAPRPAFGGGGRGHGGGGHRR